jgi:hypothetical protein
MPDLKFAELIDGVVYMPTPLSVDHGDYDAIVDAWGAVYADRCRIARVSGNITWLMLDDGAPQPDTSIRVLPEFGGTSRLEGGLAAGVPELAVEIAKSSRAYDLGQKLNLYERAGVQEYLAALLKERRLEWRVLRDGQYELLKPDSDGIYKSEIFPGLWLNEQAFWKLDFRAVLAVLDQGLQSPEFAAFQTKYQIG